MKAQPRSRIELLNAAHHPIAELMLAPNIVCEATLKLDQWTMLNARHVKIYGPLPAGTVMFRGVIETPEVMRNEAEVFPVADPVQAGLATMNPVLRFVPNALPRSAKTLEEAAEKGLVAMHEVGITPPSRTPDFVKRIVNAAVEAGARNRAKPAGHKISVPCSNRECGRVTVTAVGELDAAESRCTHSMRLNQMRGMMGSLECTNCTLAIDMRDVREALAMDPYDQRSNTLADKAQKLADENRAILVENAQLRRELETLQRKAKKQ